MSYSMKSAHSSMAESYIERKLQIIKNAFRSNIIQFIETEKKIIFKYSLNEIEMMAIALYTRTLLPIEISELSLESGTTYVCTDESYIKLKALNDSIEKIECPICGNPGIFKPPTIREIDFETIHFKCQNEHSFSKVIDLRKR